MEYINKLLDLFKDVEYPFLLLCFLTIAAVEMLIIGAVLLVFCILQST